MSASKSSCCGGGSQQSAPQAHPCECDCAQCRAACCQLECLVHPRFYCGQLLTDQDLSVMVDWIKNKTGLARYRDGWGVVCGLDVICSGAKQPASVNITPGYAVTCCGDDVVVCKEASLDLGPYCSGADDCDPPRRRPPANAPRETITLGGLTFDRDEITAVDIYLQYAQKLIEPQVAIANRGCTPSQYCEYGRVQEGHALCVRKVSDPCAAPSAYAAWLTEYQENLRTLLQLREEGLRQPQEAARRLREWILQHPLHQFCHLVRILCEQYEQNLDRQRFEELWFWVQQDWRNNFFRCACTGCEEDYGVPLARVWLRSYSPRPGTPRECHVVVIDPYPPYRRPLARDCPLAPPGAVNLAELIWQPVEQTCVALARHGIHIARMIPMSPGEAWRLTEPPVFQMCASSADDNHEDRWLVVYTHEDACRRQRVVGFASWIDPRQLRLDTIDGIAAGKAKRLAEHNIGSVVELSRAKQDEVEAALQGLPGVKTDDAANMIERARNSIGDLMRRNPTFKPWQ
jgi:hypothetical protein